MDLQSVRPTNQLVPGKYGARWYAVLPGSCSSDIAFVIVMALFRFSRFSFGGASWLSAL